MPACRTCNDSGIIRTAGGGCEPCPMCEIYETTRRSPSEPKTDWVAVAIYLAIAAIAVVGVGLAYGVIG